MRKCKCKSDMEYVGSMGNDGRYWCPECGRYSQSYACVPMEWKTPRNLPKAEASHAVLSEVRAIEKALDIMDELIKYHAHYCDVEMPEEKAIREKAIVAIKKISEHFR